PEQCPAIRFRRRLQAFTREPLLNKGVDRAPNVRYLRDRWPLYRLVGPVAFVDGALGHPAADRLFLGGGELFVGIDGWHLLGGSGREDALDDGAFLRISWH